MLCDLCGLRDVSCVLVQGVIVLWGLSELEEHYVTQVALQGVTISPLSQKVLK